MDKVTRYLFFGDSITYGSRDREGGWVDRLKRVAMEIDIDPKEERLQILNLGIGSDTSQKLLARIESETKARLSSSWKTGLVVAVGINDGRQQGGVEAEVPLPEFTQNYRQILEIAKKHSLGVTTIGLTCLAEDKIQLRDIAFFQEEVEKYDQAIQDISDEAKVSYVSLKNVLGPDDFIDDGLHPNTDGHRKIFERLKPVFIP